MPAPPVFAVRRLFSTDDDTRSVLAGPAVVATFATREEAEADCARLEREVREISNPFDFYQGCLGLLTSLSPEVLRDWMQDAGIEPPGEGDDWEAWWDENAPNWPAAGRELAWRAFDKVRLYDVVEPRPTRKLYVVMWVDWAWAGEPPFYADRETHLPSVALASRQKAEQRRAELEENVKNSFEPDDEFEWVTAEGKREAGRRDGAPFFRIVEIEGEDVGNQRVYIVQRASVYSNGCLENYTARGLKPTVPLRAFPDRDSGEAYRRDLDRLARRWLSPFQLFHGQMDVMRRTEEEICQAISVLGLPAPLPVPGSPSDASITQRRDLAGWWDQHVARMTEEQFDAVWALCDRVRLYTVAEVALDAEG